MSRGGPHPQSTPTLARAVDPRLTEAAVLDVMGRRPLDEQWRFHRDREAAYELPDPERREDAFRRLYARWAHRLALFRPLDRALAEQPELALRVAGCRVVLAASPHDEHADLSGTSAPPLLVIRVGPGTLIDEATCLTWLRHELQHIADMLDPGFGYERDLPALDGGPAADRLLRQRYHVVWDATIDGRLLRRGLLPETVRAERRTAFLRTFPMLGPRAETSFARWFDEPQPTHRAILDFVLSVRIRGVPRDLHPDATLVCPICRFPTTARALVVDALAPAVVDEIRRRHPAWQPEEGVCRQCADLYQVRLFGLTG